MFRRYIEKICRGVLSECFKEKTVLNPPADYKPLPIIRGKLFEWTLIPFNSGRVWCELRSLNANQIEACGNFALLSSILKQDRPPTRTEMIEMRNIQERLCIAVLNRPTYKEIETIIFERDNVFKEKRAELTELKTELAAKEKFLTREQFNALSKQVDDLEFFCGYILPEDTFGFLTRWALGQDISEIKKLSRTKLLEASVLAKNASKAPTDYISGVFTDRDKTEIDRAAWQVYDEWRAEKEAARGR
jgi:hypothetical protein